MTADGTITTAAELDALPVGSVVRDGSGDEGHRCADGRWCYPETALLDAEHVAKHRAPLTVLFRPDAPQLAPVSTDAVEQAISIMHAAAIMSTAFNQAEVDSAGDTLRSALAAARAGEAEDDLAPALHLAMSTLTRTLDGIVRILGDDAKACEIDGEVDPDLMWETLAGGYVPIAERTARAAGDGAAVDREAPMGPTVEASARCMAHGATIAEHHGKDCAAPSVRCQCSTFEGMGLHWDTCPGRTREALSDGAEVDREALVQSVLAHVPVVSVYSGLIVGCRCMDRVFVRGHETWAEHVAAALAVWTAAVPSEED